VQGGFLVGDKIQHLIEGEAERLRKLAAGDADEEPEPVMEEPKKSKKRKLEDQEERTEANEVKAKKSKKRKSGEGNQTPGVFAVKVKKSKKKRKSETSLHNVAGVTAEIADAKIKSFKKTSKGSQEAEEEEASEKDKEKQDKKDRKKKREKSKSEGDKKSTKDSRKKSKREKNKANAEVLSQPTESLQSTPKEHTPLETDSGRSTPIMVHGRHAVRARNIAQKRLASMDVASLNQVRPTPWKYMGSLTSTDFHDQALDIETDNRIDDLL